MTLKDAIQEIKTCAQQMNVRYGNVVFDEFALVSLAGKKGRVLAYIGPRRTGFQKNFLTDAGPLMEGLLTQNSTAGDFEFARHGVGTCFEAFMTVGDGLFLICNNTVQSMDTIAKDPRWIGAQVPFADLSDKFRYYPLTMGSKAQEAHPVV